jgi:putative glutamine amidotransferase
MSADPASSAPRHKPLVLVPACNRMLGGHPFHVCGRKYVDAVRLAGCLPLVVPNASPDDLPALLDLADGLLLTGAPANVHPNHYGEEVHDPSLPLDPQRDAWTLPFIREALARGMPLIGICRGAQETNVALGGTLHQAVQEVEGHLDHRADDTLDVEQQYDHTAHDVEVMPGGVLDALLETKSFRVNSLHGQAVKHPAEGLRVEARAPDGVVEAFSVEGVPGFNLLVQWHPEWRAEHNAVSRRLFEAFGRACADYRQRHRA